MFDGLDGTSGVGGREIRIAEAGMDAAGVKIGAGIEIRSDGSGVR